MWVFLRYITCRHVITLEYRQAKERKERNCIAFGFQRIRGFGSDALYKFTFYITFSWLVIRLRWAAYLKRQLKFCAVNCDFHCVCMMHACATAVTAGTVSWLCVCHIWASQRCRTCTWTARQIKPQRQNYHSAYNCIACWVLLGYHCNCCGTHGMKCQLQ